MKLHLQSCEKEVLELVKQNKIFQSHFLDESEKKLFLHKREKSGYEIMFSTNKCEIFYKTLPELNRALLYVASTDVEENIKEECSFRELGVLIDVSRNAVVKVETLKKFIRILSLLGYNFCGLYIEDTIKIKNEPYFGYLRGAFTEKEIKEIDEYAQKYEIELRPYIQTLAHLNQIVRYEEYQKIIDTDDILLVGDKRTEILLENLIGTIAQCFSSRKLNIGMDEAHMLGLGKYLNRNGYQNRQEIMRKHLEKVLEICRKYGFKVQMWSDMFFRLAFQGEYYSHDIKKLENVEIPPDVEIGYWDYYSIEKEHYESMIRNHKMLTENVAFIGSAWKWTGFIPHNRYSILNGKAALPVCREQKIASVTLTCWGDDGAEASVFSILPTLYEDANLAYTSKMEENAFRLVTGYNLKEFLMLDDVNPYTENGNVHNNASKYLLYNDPLIGVFDSLVEADIAEWYRNIGNKMKDFSQREEGKEFSYIFDTAYRLCSVLEKKAYLGRKIKEAYDKKEIDRLKEISIKEIPDILDRVEQLYRSFRIQWDLENKQFGFEVQSIRFGGLIQRLKDTKRILDEYMKEPSGKIDMLEEERLPFHYFEEKEIAKLNYNLWKDIVSTSKI